MQISSRSRGGKKKHKKPPKRSAAAPESLHPAIRGQEERTLSDDVKMWTDEHVNINQSIQGFRRESVQDFYTSVELKRLEKKADLRGAQFEYQ